MFRLLCLPILIRGHPAPAAAQATGSIAGLVTDQSAAVLPGVTVEARNAATGQVRHTVTGPDGFYTLPLLQPGRYDIKATLTGFKPMGRPGIAVSVAATSPVAVNPPVGDLQETLTGPADTPLSQPPH